MHVGTQQFTTSDEDLEFLARYGVANKNENFITFHRAYGWDVEELVQKKEKCTQFGIDMEMVALPMARLNVNGGGIPNFMLGNQTAGDQEIDLVSHSFDDLGNHEGETGSTATGGDSSREELVRS